MIKFLRENAKNIVYANTFLTLVFVALVKLPPMSLAQITVPTIFFVGGLMAVSNLISWIGVALRQKKECKLLVFLSVFNIAGVLYFFCRNSYWVDAWEYYERFLDAEVPVESSMQS